MVVDRHGWWFHSLVFTADYCVYGEIRPKTLTHLDSYCRRVSVHDLSNVNLGTFGRKFAWEVLGFVGPSVNIHHWTSPLQSAGKPGWQHNHRPCECLPSLCAFRLLHLLPTIVRCYSVRRTTNEVNSQQCKMDRNSSIQLHVIAMEFVTGGLSVKGGACLWMTLSATETLTPSARAGCLSFFCFIIIIIIIIIIITSMFYITRYYAVMHPLFYSRSSCGLSTDHFFPINRI